MSIFRQFKPVDTNEDLARKQKEAFDRKARTDLDGQALVRSGRKPDPNSKKLLTLRLDPQVIEHFRATGEGWQTRMNDALRKAAGL